MHNLVDSLIAAGPVGIFLLALLDSAGIPIPAGVDAMVVFFAAMSSSIAVWPSTLAVIGSTAGCLILFVIGRQGGRLYLDRKTAEGKAHRFRDQFQRYGLVTVFVPAFLPIPLPTKIFVLSAGALGVSPWRFTLVVLSARIPRYFALAYLGARYGRDALAYMKQHAPGMTFAGLGLFAAMLMLVVLKERLRKPAPPFTAETQASQGTSL